MRVLLLLTLLAACSSPPTPSGAGGLADLTDPDAAPPATSDVVPDQPTKDDALGRGRLNKGDYAAIRAEIRCLGDEHRDAVLRAHNADATWLQQVDDRVAAEPEKQARIAQEIDAQFATLCPGGEPSELLRGRLGPQ